MRVTGGTYKRRRIRHSSGGARKAPSAQRGSAGRPLRRRPRGATTRRVAWGIGGLSVVLCLVAFVTASTSTDSPSRPATKSYRPANVEVTTKNTAVTASWDTNSDVDAFRVEFADNPGFVRAETRRSTDRRMVIDSLQPDTTYYLRVRAISPTGRDSDPSSLVRFTTQYPVEPPKVKVTSPDSTTLVTSWSRARDPQNAVRGRPRYEVQMGRGEKFRRDKRLETVKRQKTFRELVPDRLHATRVRVVDRRGEPQSDWSEPALLSTPPYEPLGVGTYNILKWRERNWSARRTAVADLIRSSNVDVVGLQEALPSAVPGGPPQFQDVVNLLGPDWAATRTTPGPTGETRTVYNRSTLKLVDEGYQLISGSTRFRGVPRYVTWAVFEQKSTDKRFIFVNTHFTPGRGGSVARHRAAAAQQLTAAVQAVNVDDLPVIIGGDFNAVGHRNPSSAIYRTITGAGYIDPLVRSGALGQAEKLVNANLKTANNLMRTAPRRPDPPFLDHIFVSPMRVSQWQVAAKLNGAGQFIGTIPSDHNMVRATVYLP